MFVIIIARKKLFAFEANQNGVCKIISEVLIPICILIQLGILEVLF